MSNATVWCAIGRRPRSAMAFSSWAMPPSSQREASQTESGLDMSRVLPKGSARFGGEGSAFTGDGAVHRHLRGFGVFGFVGIGAPLADDLQPGFDQVEAVEESGRLLAGARGEF